METNDTKNLLDTVLHPVRMRVLMALTGSEGMTPLQMAEILDDVPHATLYRHINRLASAGLLRQVEERPVRGPLEKVYALSQTNQATLSPEDFAQLSKEDHLRYFTAFAVSLMDEFSRYLNQRGSANILSDGVGYSQVAVFMTDEELAQFGATINQALMPHLQPGDVPGRKKRFLATVMMPDVSGQ